MPSTISAGTTAGTAIAIAGDTTGNLAFQTNGTTTAMTITTAQNVGVGTTSPGALLSTRNGYVRVQAANQTIGDFSQRVGFEWTQETDIQVAKIEVSRPSWGNAPSNMLFFTRRESDGAVTQQMSIDQAGRVTTPNQPYCIATPPNSFSIPSNTETLISGTWIANSNIGNNFNTSGGIFTAPVAGVYEIVWTVFFNSSSANRMDVFIYLNGTIVARKEQQKWGTNSNNNSSQIVATLLLAANDQIRFGVYSSSTTTLFSSGQPWQFASVYLLG